MVDRIQKTLRKIPGWERNALERLIERILKNDIAGLDIKKLQGREDVYRVRKGDLRIIFQYKNGLARILNVERRSDTTYHAF